MISIPRTADSSPPDADAGSDAASSPIEPTVAPLDVAHEPPHQVDPLSPETERRLLADLKHLAVSRAETEKRLAEAFAANNESADHEHTVARREQAARFDADSQQASGDFATLKRRMGLGAIRYRGLAKATGQVMIAAMAFNMRRWVTITG